MDQLPSFGREIFSVVGPTAKLFTPALLQNASSILSTPKETFSYGANPRQQLDVYSSKSQKDASGKPAPILIFVYGGGFVVGNKILPHVPQGLVHANIGHFFTERGFITVIPDYRLISHGAKFPSGGEDIAGTVEWVKKHYGNEPRDLFILGNSAGGVHVMTFMLSPLFKDIRDSVSAENKTGLRWKGAVILAAPYHYRLMAEKRADSLVAYYGDRVQEDCPLGLLKASPEAARGSPKVLILYATLDPEEEIVQPNLDFIEEWRNLPRKNPDVKLLEGHNHISPVFTLGTGKSDQEAWGNMVADWIDQVEAERSA